MSLNSLTQIGKYRVHDIVGEGAMGIVFRAQDTVLNRVVALKVMNDGIAREAELRDRFLREAQAAGSLQHPNVVTVYDFGEVDGHLYIAMEFVEGADLERVMAQRQPLTLDSKLGVAIDLLSGLAYAHKRGIVHRDIKPANIRITEDARAKIMDFGVVHLTSSNMTRTGMMMGTPSYMSPEQVTGGRVSPATDIFAAGAVLYELLTGTKAFDGPTLHAIMFKIVSGEPPDIRTIAPTLPASLGHIVNRALRKEMSDRYDSALEMANELSIVRAGLSGAPEKGTLSLRASMARELAGAASRPRRDTGQQRRRVIQWTGALVATVAVAVSMWSFAARRDTVSRVVSEEASLSSRAAQRPDAQAPIVPVPSTSVADPAPSQTAPARDEPRAEESRTSASSTPPPAVDKQLERSRQQQTTRQLLVPLPPAPVVSHPVITPVAPPPPAPPAPPAQHQAAAASAPVTAPPPGASAASDVINAYARAIESRDIGSVRRVYAGITPSQQRGFEQFFDAAKTLHVAFSVTQLDISGSTADAKIVGTYDYTATDGQRQRQPVTFRATLKQDGQAWRLAEVR